MSQDSLRPGASSNWRALLAAVCLAQAISIVGFDFTLPFIPLYLQHNLGVHGLAQTALWAGLIGFGPAIPATIFGPLWGRLADRFGYRTMLLRAITCAAIMLSLMGLAPSPGILLFLRMVQGALTGTVFAAQALVASSVPESETGRSMGLLQMSVFLGATIGPVAGGSVATLLGFRTTYLCAGLLLMLAAVIVFFLVKEPKQHTARRASDEKRPSMLSVLAIPAFAAALALTLGVQLASTSLLPIVPLFVQDLLHSSSNVAASAGWIMAVSGILAGAGSYTAGRLQRHLDVKPLLLVALPLSAALVVPQAFVGSYLGFMIARSISAFAFGMLVSLVGTLAAVASPRDAKGTAFGLIGAASSMGFGAGPLLGGSLTAVLGIRPLFLFSAGMLLVGPAVLFSLASGVRMGARSFGTAKPLRAENE